MNPPGASASPRFSSAAARASSSGSSCPGVCSGTVSLFTIRMNEALILVANAGCRKGFRQRLYRTTRSRAECCAFAPAQASSACRHALTEDGSGRFTRCWVCSMDRPPHNHSPVPAGSLYSTAGRGSRFRALRADSPLGQHAHQGGAHLAIRVIFLRGVLDLFTSDGSLHSQASSARFETNLTSASLRAQGQATRQCHDNPSGEKHPTSQPEAQKREGAAGGKEHRKSATHRHTGDRQSGPTARCRPLSGGSARDGARGHLTNAARS